MAKTALQAVAPVLRRIQVLEYGKFCSSLDGPIEPLAEYRVLGQSLDFPEEVARICSPQHYGLSKNTVETESLGLLDARDRGTVIWPVRTGNAMYYLCYRVGRRSEGGPRNYSVARYLCSTVPLNPWIYYRAMSKLRGLTREKASEIEPLEVAASDSIEDEECAKALVQRVMSGLDLRRPIHALIDDEESFFRLCGTVWNELTESQRALLSCGWNVSPSIGRRLVISFGPEMPESASRLDPAKQLAPSPGKKKWHSSRDMFKSIEEALAACRSPLGSDGGNADPLHGFDDPHFTAVFFARRLEEALIEWIPDILQMPTMLQEDDADRQEVVRSLLRFDESLQYALYRHLDQNILESPAALRAFASIERQCRQKWKAWGGVRTSFAVGLAVRLQDADTKGGLGEFLAGLGEDDLARSDRLAALATLLWSAVSKLSGSTAITTHKKLLAGKLPGWYRQWLARNGREAVLQMLEVLDGPSLSRLGEELGESPLIAVAKAIADGRPPGAADEETIKRLDHGAMAALATCLYRFWLHNTGEFGDWLERLSYDLPPSLLKHYLSAWEGEQEQIATDIRREFQQSADDERSTLLDCLRWLCDHDRAPVALTDQIWTDYLEIARDFVVRMIAGWQGRAANRLRLRLSAHDGQPGHTVTSLLEVAAEGSLSSLGAEDTHCVLKALEGLIGDADHYKALDSLILGWPDWPPLRSWLHSIALRTGAWLLQRENLPPDVFDKFVALCPGSVSKLLQALYDCAPVPAEARALRSEAAFNAEVVDWLAKYIGRKWGGTKRPDWEAVADWARWSASDCYSDPALRLLAGLSFDAELVLRRAEWMALSAANNKSINADTGLTLLRSILTGSFGIKQRPSDQSWHQTALIVRDDATFRGGRARWMDLWKTADRPWQRLFVLELAAHLTFDISPIDLAALRQEPEWLERTIRSRTVELDRTKHHSTPASRENPAVALLGQLNLAAADFQSRVFGDEGWSEDIGKTALIGAFRKVSMQLYTDEQFVAALDLYFPLLRVWQWSGDAAAALATFAQAYGPSDEDYPAALAMIDRVFLQRYVWRDSKVREAIIQDLRNDWRPASKLRSAANVFSRSTAVEWVLLSGRFVDRTGKKVRVDEGLKELIGWFVDEERHGRWRK